MTLIHSGSASLVSFLHDGWARAADTHPLCLRVSGLPTHQPQSRDGAQTQHRERVCPWHSGPPEVAQDSRSSCGRQGPGGRRVTAPGGVSVRAAAGTAQHTWRSGGYTSSLPSERLLLHHLVSLCTSHSHLSPGAEGLSVASPLPVAWRWLSGIRGERRQAHFYGGPATVPDCVQDERGREDSPGSQAGRGLTLRGPGWASSDARMRLTRCPLLNGTVNNGTVLFQMVRRVRLLTP